MVTPEGESSIGHSTTQPVLDIMDEKQWKHSAAMVTRRILATLGCHESDTLGRKNRFSERVLISEKDQFRGGRLGRPPHMIQIG